MRILYAAFAVVAPGSHGGATHVSEVAAELAKLGHELHVVCPYDPHSADQRRNLTLVVPGGGPVRFYRFRRADKIALLKYRWLARLAAQIQPDLVMERYYNFAGAALLYAHRHHLPALLEVNALMLDPPGSLKHRLDGLTLRRLEWWARQQCDWAGRIVTPLHTTVPAGVSRAKIAELPWGANVERFDRAKVPVAEVEQLRRALGLPDGARVGVFAGSFRHWHGVDLLVQAALRLVPQDDKLFFLLLGGGPELASIRQQIRLAGLEKRILTPGLLDHTDMPRYLALADCGVAPFDPARHPPLRHAGFFWSPLKIFEYMAMALPVITIAVPPLDTIIRSGQEGLLYPPSDWAGLVKAMQEMLAPGLEAAHRRRAMGQAARRRVVEQFSWAAHARALAGLMHELTAPKIYAARPGER